MIDLRNLDETVYFLPEDGLIAKQAWLDFIAMPTEGWFLVYGCNMPKFFELNAQHEANGIAQHILGDHLQGSGRSVLKLIKDYATKIKVGSFTLTTAGVGSSRTSQIFHYKVGIKRTLDGTGYICWDGSVNFSESGWLQGNVARIFSSTEFAEAVIKEYEIHRTWAREHEPQYQVSALSTDPITSYFASSTQYDVITDIQDGIKKFDLANFNQEKMDRIQQDFKTSMSSFSKNKSKDIVHNISNIKKLVEEGVAILALHESLGILNGTIIE